MDIIERARILRRKIEQNAAVMPDEDALNYAELFPNWSITEYSAGDRVRYNGTLYKALQGHTAQPDWTPDAAPSLWAEVLIPDPNVIPEWRQPDNANPYMIGDRVMFEGKVYESLIDNNVWSPADYPEGWQEVI